MLDNIQLENILFLDIETVPQYESYEDLPERFKPLWNRKAARLAKSGTDTPEKLYERAGIYAEFGKIVCISAGLFYIKNGVRCFKLKSYYGSDEKQLLAEFNELLNKYNGQEKYLCGHNGKEFDFPYIARRSLINGLKLPETLNMAGKKPWDVKHLDTMELWKFGDYKSYTSLNLLAAIFDIPTPKGDIDGSQVRQVFYADKNIERIAAYCEKDVLTTARVYLKYNGLENIENENVMFSVNYKNDGS